MNETDNIQVSSSSYIDLVSPSSRGPALRLALRKNDGSDDSVEIRPSPSLSQRQPAFVLPLSRQDASEGSSNLYVYERQQQQFTYDDAFLHYDPNQHQSTHVTGDQIIYSNESDIRQCISTRPISTGNKGQSTMRKSASPGHSDSSSSTKKGRKKQTKPKQRKVQDIDPPLNEEWEARLKEYIIQDETLYLRILRYEVCHAYEGCDRD